MDSEEKVTSITPNQALQIRGECNKRIEIAGCLKRLEQNTDFKKVFLEDYQKEESVRLVGLLGEDTFNMSDKKSYYREDIKERLIGISRFAEYMRNVYRLADQATKTLEDLNSAEVE